MSVAVASLQSAAWAQSHATRALQLSWTAPASCPAERDVIAMADDYLGARDRMPDPISVRADVSADGQVFELRFEVTTKAGTARRQLRDADCDALAKSAALLIALALDPLLGEQPMPAARARQPASKKPAAGPPAAELAPPVSEPRADARRELSISAGAGVALYASLLPGGLATSVVVGASAQLSPLRIGLDFGFVAPSAERSSAYAAAELRMSAAIGAAQACYDFDWQRLWAGACARGELGTLSAEVRAIEDPRSQSSLWLAGGGGLSLRYRFVPRLAVVLEGSAVLPSNRPRFFIETPDGQVALYRMDAFSVRVATRIDYVF